MTLTLFVVLLLGFGYGFLIAELSGGALWVLKRLRRRNNHRRFLRDNPGNVLVRARLATPRNEDPQGGPR